MKSLLPVLVAASAGIVAADSAYAAVRNSKIQSHATTHSKRTNSRVIPIVGSYMPFNGLNNNGLDPTNIGRSPTVSPMVSPMVGSHIPGAGQIPQYAYPGQFNTTLGGMQPIWTESGNVQASHPFASPNVQRPLYMDMNVQPSYWSQASPNHPIGSGLPSFIETNSRTHGDDGQAYWLPPASGDESAGGGGGAAPASPGTSQYSVSPQAFYQGGGAAGAGGGAAAVPSFIEIKTKTKTRTFMHGDDIPPPNDGGYYLPPVSAKPKRKQRFVSATLSLLEMANFPKGTNFASKTSTSTSPMTMQQPMRFQQQHVMQPQQQQPQPQPQPQQQQQQPQPQQQQQQPMQMQMQPQPSSPQTQSNFMSKNRFSLTDNNNANAFDQMHQSWIPSVQKQAMGTITPANSGMADGLTGAGFMALLDPGASSSGPQLRRL